MSFDLVFPERNERQLVEMAGLLGTRELVLCYPLGKFQKELRTEAERLGGDVKVSLAIFCKNQAEVQKARGLKLPLVCRGGPGIYEDKRIAYVIGFESGSRSDFMHHRNSGLTQVFINKGMQSGKTFLVDLHQLMEAKDRGEILGRMMQNNRFFRKYRPDVRVVSGATTPMEMRSPGDMRAFLRL